MVLVSVSRFGVGVLMFRAADINKQVQPSLGPDGTYVEKRCLNWGVYFWRGGSMR